MNGKVAKRLRKQVYGDNSIKNTDYEVATTQIDKNGFYKFESVTLFRSVLANRIAKIFAKFNNAKEIGENRAARIYTQGYQLRLVGLRKEYKEAKKAYMSKCI